MKHYRREEASHQQGFDALDVKQHQEDIPSELHHHISASRNQPVPLATFVREHPDDPAKKVRLYYSR